MTLLLYFDHQVRVAVAHGLRRRQVDVLTAFEDGTATWDDERILNRATQLGRTVFTHDDDFLSIAGRWLESGQDFAGVVFVHPLKMTIGQLVHDLEIVAKALDPEEIRNEIEYLPL